MKIHRTRGRRAGADLDDLLNAALQQSGWEGRTLAQGSWRRTVGERLDALDWTHPALDGAHFLERRVDVEWIRSPEGNALGLLA